MSLVNNEIVIKGVRNGVLVSLPPAHWFKQRDALITKIQTQERFFKGGRIAIDVGGAEWTEDQLSKLMRDLSDEGVYLWAVISTCPLTLTSAHRLDLATSILNRETESDAPANTGNVAHWMERDLEQNENLIVDGDLMLIGNVPNNATLSVSGSLVVWGKVEGSIRLTGADQKFNRALLLAYDGISLKFCGEEVTIPRKLRASTALYIRQTEAGMKISPTSFQKFKIL